MIFVGTDTDGSKTYGLACSCHNKEHMMYVSRFGDDYCFEISMHPCNGLLRRLRLAFKYVLGRSFTRYQFEEVIVGREHLDEVIAAVKGSS